jgi:hypothetical protein
MSAWSAAAVMFTPFAVQVEGMFAAAAFTASDMRMSTVRPVGSKTRFCVTLTTVGAFMSGPPEVPLEQAAAAAAASSAE